MHQLPMYFTFPVIRGVQAGREYYVTMCPLRLVPKIFIFDDTELDPQVRSQRVLNKARIPEIVNYMVENSQEYVFSSITASVDGPVEFIPVSNDPSYYNIGSIRIPMSAKFILNDGQHRRAAIEEAIRKKPELGDETISVVLFIDEGLKRSQQMFADLNRYAIRTNSSLNILYDYRDPIADITRQLIQEIDVFHGLTELEKSSISNRSPKLFTLSALYRATKELLADVSPKPIHEQKKVAYQYWTEVSSHITEWQLARQGLVKAVDLRKDYLSAHAISLVALGCVGRVLLSTYPNEWKEYLKALKRINWHRSNSCWEGRVTIGGKISFSRNNLVLLINVIKKILGLELTPEEQEAEQAHLLMR